MQSNAVDVCDTAAAGSGAHHDSVEDERLGCAGRRRDAAGGPAIGCGRIGGVALCRARFDQAPASNAGGQCFRDRSAGDVFDWHSTG